MKQIFVVISSIFLFYNVDAQEISSKLIGKTYSRTFYAMVFKHLASYTFYKNKVVYQVKGFFVNDKYFIEGQWQGNKFVGKDPKSGQEYEVFVDIVSHNKIRVNKRGVNPVYNEVLKDKPVDGWHEYYLKK